MKDDEDILKIELTNDGSATIFIPQMDEHYHSIKGALTESCHIYRDCAFIHRSNISPCHRLRLLEIGFGTGLNATVTAMAATKQTPIHYISLEKYPVKRELLNQLGYEKIIDSTLFNAIHDAQWNTPVEITPHFTLEKRCIDYTSDNLPKEIDIVYFDAFAPEKQPDMWTPQAFARLRDTMNQGGVLTTYCAKGEIRRLLTSLGFNVERLPGPVGGKREIIRATLI